MPILYRIGGQVVAEKSAPWPDRCVKCNAAANGYRKKLELSWHEPALYVLILAGLLVYLIVALIVRKQTTINLPLCERHRARRSRIMWTGGVIAFLCLPTFFGAISMENGWLALAGVLLFLGGVIVLVAGAQTVTTKKIDHLGNAWLKGACKEFLAELPDPPHAQTAR